MGRTYDFAGQRFGRLTVVAAAGFSKHRWSQWECKCDCGRTVVVLGRLLKIGRAKSCGCLRAEHLAAGRAALHKAKRTHGGSQTREHHIWLNIIYRCDNPNSTGYPRYGGRGITVCERWRGAEGFASFLADMGMSPSPKHTVDRKDNDGPYSPENCRWATRKQQATNRRNNRWFTRDGMTLTGTDWARRLGLTKSVFYKNIPPGLVEGEPPKE